MPLQPEIKHGQVVEHEVEVGQYDKEYHVVILCYDTGYASLYSDLCQRFLGRPWKNFLI